MVALGNTLLTERGVRKPDISSRESDASRTSAADGAWKRLLWTGMSALHPGPRHSGDLGRLGVHESIEGFHPTLGQPHFLQAEQKGQRGFGALVEVDAVQVQAVVASPRCRVIHRQPKVVATQKPFKGPTRLPEPEKVARAQESLQACRHRRARLDRLL